MPENVSMILCFFHEVIFVLSFFCHPVRRVVVENVSTRCYDNASCVVAHTSRGTCLFPIHRTRVYAAHVKRTLLYDGVTTLRVAHSRVEYEPYVLMGNRADHCVVYIYIYHAVQYIRDR